MINDYEAVSQAMTDPDADFDALTKKMERLQVLAGLRALGIEGAPQRRQLQLLAYSGSRLLSDPAGVVQAGGTAQERSMTRHHPRTLDAGHT